MRNTQPNIVLIMTDQQSANMLSCSGTPWLYTPALDALAARGVRFEHAVCANPICVPSRTSIATGAMPGRFGVDDNTNGMTVVLPDAVGRQSLGNLMKSAGYATFYGGKVHMCEQLSPSTAGYDVYHENERDTLADACINFISADRTDPFFAVASFINPHDICYVHNAKVQREPRLDHVTDLFKQAAALPDDLLPPLPPNVAVPANEPGGMRARTDAKSITPSGTMYTSYSERDWRIYRWVYARLTEAVDTQIGRILAVVDHQRSLAGRAADQRPTVVLFVSDHGNMHANHGLASKGVFYDESVCVPFIVADSNAIPAGRVDSQTLINIGLDLLPTCCDYAGIPVPAGCLGSSVRPAAENPGTPAPIHSRRYVASENSHGRMIRGSHYKYTVYTGTGQREMLNDLAADPGELRNLAVEATSAELLAEQRRLLREWFEASDDQTGLQHFVVG